MPNSRSKTKRGLVSAGSGIVGVFHDIEFMYAQAYPWSHAPTTSLRSTDTSSDDSFESRQICCGDHLIDRRARLHVGAFGLLRMHTAHEGRRGARMLPAEVALVRRREVVQPGEDERPVAERLERLQDRREREAGAFGGGRPVVHVRAVAAIDRRKSRRRLGQQPDIAGIIASRSGNATVAPMPRMNVRRGNAIFVITIRTASIRLIRIASCAILI